ncbi:MAG: CCA tRNA nucleotidyltransferase, partial [Simkaniaceae bacterium]|nr:CCA tRNA nucleotidyltransferase [Simkaniaceae bacterium]
NAALEVINRLVEKGHTAYYAGGYVRDMIMGHPSDDIDIATTASVKEIQSVFEKTIPVGVQLGIVIVVINTHQFEVATFRKEDEYKDGRRPTKIEPTTPANDAQRRDFTINGMFYNPITEELIDYVEGQKDIEHRIIRAIGDPRERFMEDRLRMIRAVRYAARFHFAIETKTKRAIKHHAKDLFPSVAIERVWQELEKMHRFSNFAEALVALHQLELLPVIFPPLIDLSVEEIESRLIPLGHYPADTPLILLILELFPTYTLAEKLHFCELFKRPSREKNLITFCFDLDLHAKHTPHKWAHLYAHPFFKTAFGALLAHYHTDEREKLIDLHHAREHKLKESIDRIKNNDPIVKSSHLKAAGIKPGPKMGKLLEKAEAIAINESMIDPDTVLKKLFE